MTRANGRKWTWMKVEAVGVDSSRRFPSLRWRMMQGGHLSEYRQYYIMARLSMGPSTPITRGVKYDVRHRG